jgi:hypothetical protein
MTADDPNSDPMDAEDCPETLAGTTPGAGAAETEIVPRMTQAAPRTPWQARHNTGASIRDWLKYLLGNRPSSGRCARPHRPADRCPRVRTMETA